MVINALKKNSGYLHEFFTCVLFFVLPFPDQFLSLALVLWGGSWLIWRLLNVQQKNAPSSQLKTASWLFLFFVLFNYLSAFWGEDPSLGGAIMERRLSFLILATILLFGIYPHLRAKRLILFYFYGNVAALLLFCFQFIVRYFFDGVLKYQVDMLGLDDVVNAFKHPAYFSLNLVLSLFLYLSLLKKTSKFQRWTVVLSYIVFFVVIYQSGSRAGLLNLAVLSLGGLFYISRRYFVWWKTTLIALPFIIVFVFGVVSSEKFSLVLDHSEQVAVRAPRKVLWPAALDLALEKPLFGYGIGSSKVAFVSYCKEKSFGHADAVAYNVHNQFLEFVLENGLLGLLLFLAMLVFFVRCLPTHKRWIAIGVIMVFSIALMFESMLLRVAGISTFVSMLLLLVVMSQEKEPENEGGKDKLLLFFVSFAMLLLIVVLSLYNRSSSIGFDANHPNTYISKEYTFVDHDDFPGSLPEGLSPLTIDGAMFDAQTKASLWSGNAYLVNKVEEKSLEEDELLTFSAYCYVSPDFDGSWVKISIDLTGKPPLAENFYDLNEKGTWQLLELKVEGKSGPMPAHFFFCRNNSNSFTDLKGYVIYVYPQYTITKKALNN